MKVAVFQVDGPMPNLALMKLTTHALNSGDEVRIYRNIGDHIPLDALDADLALVSAIFPKNREKALTIGARFPRREVAGSGVDMKAKLPDGIEHLMPAYEAWDVPYSMGFTSRGCVRRCDFCIVPDKEGPFRPWAPLREFLHPDHNQVILLDNNFLAHPEWKDILLDIQSMDLKVNVNSGLDIRLMTEEKAGVLADTKLMNWKFTGRTIHVAFDDPALENQVVRGIKMMKAAGIKCSIVCYILVAFNTTLEEDLHRIEVIRDLGAYPYVMVYNREDLPRKKHDPIYRHLQRWSNRHYWRYVTFEEYREDPYDMSKWRKSDGEARPTQTNEGEEEAGHP